MRRLLVVLGLLAGALRAQGAEPGLQLHLDLGPGYSRSAATMNDITQRVSGLGVSHAVTLGWVTRSGWTMGGEYWGTFVYSPEIDTMAPSNGGGLLYKVYGFGPTVRYRFGSGLFFSATPSVTRVSLSDNDDNGFAWRWGFGARATAGWDWPLGERWSVGLAGVFQLAVNQQKEHFTPRWTTLSGGVVVSLGFR